MRCTLVEMNVSASSTLRRSMKTQPSSASVWTSWRLPSVAHSEGEWPMTTKCVLPNARPSDLASSAP